MHKGKKDLNDSVFIDVVAYDDPPKSLEVTTVLSQTTSTVIQCPCAMFDRKCIAIKCTSCKKDWHTECCNLTSVTPTVVKKLETHSWECPWCYHPAIQKPGDGHQPDISTKKTYDLFISNMARVQNCTEELNENITAIEFFNKHIKHLLLDESKFKTHTVKIDKLSADITDLKD